ncbi:MAG: HEPN domain-containing protein [Eubacteriales bacterium]
MGNSVESLSQYRLEMAMENLEAARVLLKDNQYKSSINRSYYAIFHALRAVTVLENFDSSKHSGIIAFFNRHYVKEGIFGKELSKIIDSSYRLREKADYQDFVIVSKEQAEEQLNKAKIVLELIGEYLRMKWTEV